MATPAFLLNDQFITRLRERIGTQGDTPSPLAGMGLDLPQGEAPSRVHLAELLDAVFWASHDREEGYPVSVSLIYKRPEHLPDSFCFDRPLALHTRNLVKLGPALEKPRAHICTWPDEKGELRIWGFKTASHEFVTSDLWLQSLGPGTVLISHGGRSLAALTGNQAVFVDPAVLMQAIMPKLARQITPGTSNMQGIFRYNTLLYIAQAMRAHGHGGTILAVPDSSGWQSSIGQPVPYTGGASFLDANLDLPAPETEIFTGQKSFLQLIRKVFSRGPDKQTRVRAQIREQCNRIARLTAVDGALVMSFDRYTYCFGAKIKQVATLPASVDLRLRRPLKDAGETTCNISDLGGTRHQSAAQFAYDQPQAIAVVASQDGDVTFFTREESGALVAVQQAELALLHQGISGALWNISLFSRMLE